MTNGNNGSRPIPEILQCDMCRIQSTICTQRNQSDTNRKGEHHIFTLQMGTSQVIVCTAQVVEVQKMMTQLVNDMKAKGMLPGVIQP